MDNDHEAITPNEVQDRLRNGLDVIGRYGATRDDIDAVADGVNRAAVGEIALCSDVLWPEHLLDNGHMDAAIKRCIQCRIDPKDALRMATFNAAQVFDLDDRGELASGKNADIITLDDVETVDVGTVITDGRAVVKDRDVLVDPYEYNYRNFVFDTVEIDLSPKTFQVPSENVHGSRVRAIKHEEELLTCETVIEPPEVEGEFQADPSKGCPKSHLLIAIHPTNHGRSPDS